MTEVNFRIFSFIEKEGYKSIHLRTKIKKSLSVIGVKFPGEKKKKVCC